MIKIRVANQLTSHHGYAGQAGNFLGLDDLERFTSIPAVHVNQFPPGHGCALGEAVVGSHVEHGCCNQC